MLADEIGLNVLFNLIFLWKLERIEKFFAGFLIEYVFFVAANGTDGYFKAVLGF